MSEFNNIMKMWLNSLAIFDNCYFNISIIIILVLYSSVIFENINVYVSELYNYSIIRLIVLLLIIYIAPKSPTISILLGISYIISIHYMSNNLLSVSNKFEKFKSNPKKKNFKSNPKKKNFNEIKTEPSREEPIDSNIMYDDEDYDDEEYAEDVEAIINDFSEILQSPEAKEMCHDVCNALTSKNESFSNMDEVQEDASKLVEANKENIEDIGEKTGKILKYVGAQITGATKNRDGFQNPELQNLIKQLTPPEKFQNPELQNLIKQLTPPEKFSNKISSLNTCEKLHIPVHGQLSNSCDPVKLFSTEYNAQGLDNEIMGQNINYYPVGANI